MKKELAGHALSTFIREYCASHNILFDADILNDGFFKRGYVAGKSYSPAEAEEIVCSIAANWHLRDAVSQFAVLHPRNGVPPFANRQ